MGGDGRAVDDEVLDTFAVVGEPERLADQIRRRFGGLVDRLSFYTTYKLDSQVWDEVLQGLKHKAAG